MGDSTRRHRRIFRLQRAIVAGVMAVVVLLTGASAGMQSLQNNEANEVAEQVAERADFWQVIAQEANPDSTAVDDKFAIDLREAVGEIDSSATQLPAEVTDFRAGPNSYGGIERALGFNPFDNAGQSCEVCGALSAEMQENLLLIKQGQVDQIIDAEAATVATETGLNLTPLNMSLPIWIGLVYLTSTTAALVIAVRRDSKNQGYRPNILNWGTQGGTIEDTYKRFSKWLSPGYFVTVLPLSRKFDKTKDYGESLEFTGLAETERNLREMLAAINKLPLSQRTSPEVQAKVDWIHQLQREVNAQIEHFDGDVPTLRSRGNTLNMTSIEQMLGDSEMQLRARREAIEELDPGEGRGQTATG